VLTSIAADIDPPEQEVADILRRLAVSLSQTSQETPPVSRAQQPWPPPHFPDESLASAVEGARGSPQGHAEVADESLGCRCSLIGDQELAERARRLALVLGCPALERVTGGKQ
jgi:hypothetical protein